MLPREQIVSGTAWGVFFPCSKLMTYSIAGVTVQQTQEPYLVAIQLGGIQAVLILQVHRI